VSLSAEELARQAGTTPEQVERFAAEEEGLPSARVGIHADPVVFRDGDYFGGTVNTAARIADYARPREVLVSGDVVAHAEGAAVFEPIGDVGLRGLVDPAALFRALIRDSSPAD
jgi:adenylate cyclase